MGKHDYTAMDRARDELMSHVVRCEVFDAKLEHRTEWLDETMDYMAERHPHLSELQLTRLEMIGRQFIRPVISHGRKHNAMNGNRTADDDFTEAALASEALTDAVDATDANEERELQAA